MLLTTGFRRYRLRIVPTLPDAVLEVQPPESGLKRLGPNMRILIADDHELMRKGISALFENRADFEVLEASNGAEAVQRVVDDKPDLVILDVSMPVMDGFSAARQIKRIDPNILIVILTLQKTETFATIAEKIGIDGYLTKNIDGSVLRAAVDSVIEASKKRGGSALQP